MRHMHPTPLGALVRGLAAGVVGSAAQDLFFRATRKIAPHTPREAFSPPEREQIEETATQTVARRVSTHLLQRPLAPDEKPRAATAVHYAFGAALGGIYGLLRETTPAMRGAPGALAYGFGAWMVGDNLVLPAFRLGAWPNAYPLKTHAYALGAHLVFGAAVSAAYAAMRPRSVSTAAAVLWAARADVAVTRRLPAAVRPAARAIIRAAAKARAANGTSTVAQVAHDAALR